MGKVRRARTLLHEYNNHEQFAFCHSTCAASVREHVVLLRSFLRSVLHETRLLSLLPVALAVLLLVASAAQAQSPPPPDPSAASDTTAAANEDQRASGERPFRPARFALVTGSVGAFNVGLYFWEKNRWWRQELATPFHFDDDWRYSLGLDKAAHFYATEIQAFAYARALRWSGPPPLAASLMGAGIAWVVQTHVEYQDGFNRRYGFDRYDIAANTLGAAWFVAHEHVDFLRHFNIRLGYFPSKRWREGLGERRATFADDYAGHSYWLSADVEQLVPGLSFWPGWLDVSGGVSLNDWTDSEPYSGYRSYYLSLDLDTAELIPRSTGLGRAAGDLLNRVHLPFPAVRLHPDPTVHLVFYGQ